MRDSCFTGTSLFRTDVRGWNPAVKSITWAVQAATHGRGIDLMQQLARIPTMFILYFVFLQWVYVRPRKYSARSFWHKKGFSDPSGPQNMVNCHA